MIQPCCRAPNFFIKAILLLLMAILRRFLRARSWQPYPAQEQFQNAMNWRLKHDVTNLYATFDAEEFESAKRFYPRWTGRRDKVCWDTNSYLPILLRWQKKGLPLYVYRLASLNPVEKELYAVPPERRYQRMYVRQFPPSSIFLMQGKKNRSIRAHGEVQFRTLHSTSSSFKSYTNIIYDIYHRSGRGFSWFHVETPKPLTGSI